MIQYTESYSSCPSEIQNIVANDVGLLETYVLMQTGQNEWTAQIYTLGLDKCRQLRFYRSTNTGYTNTYFVERKDINEFNMTYSNEYYIFSNTGVGRSLSLPVYDGVISYSLMIISCMLMLAVVFKGVLFKCLDRRR